MLCRLFTSRLQRIRCAGSSGRTSRSRTTYRVSSAGNSNQATGDQFFSGLSYDNDNPNQFMGRAGLDHTNQLSFGGSFVLKYGPQIGMLAHFYSAPPATLFLDVANETGSPAGDIFISDVTGDGTAGDIAHGQSLVTTCTRSRATTWPRFISNYNNTRAGSMTPAGQALVAAGIFTPGQLSAIGAVQQPIATMPNATALNNPAFRSFDLNLSYPIRFHKLREGMSLEPGVAVYNIFNFSNFTSLTPTESTLLNTNDAGPVNNSAGNVAGPNTYDVQNGNRRQRGSGTFAQGAPRTTEFQLKFNF